MPADEVIILVGGLGTRLRGVIGDLPKPLAMVARRPFLGRLLDRYAAAGMRRAILAAGYQADTVRTTIGPQWAEMDIVYSIEAEPLGTGGAIRQAAALVVGDGVHVANGDTWLRYDPHALEQATRELQADIGLALAQVDDVSRYGAVRVAEQRVLGFDEKGASGAGWINAGCYYLDRQAIADLPDQRAYSIEQEVLAPWSAAGRVAAFNQTSGFIDIGVPEDYARAQALFGRQP